MFTYYAPSRVDFVTIQYDVNNFEWQRRRNQWHWFGSGGQFKWIGKVLVLPWMPSFQQQWKRQIGTFSRKGANEWFTVGQVKLGVVAKEIGKVTMANLWLGTWQTWWDYSEQLQISWQNYCSRRSESNQIETIKWYSNNNRTISDA